ncbi:L-rhamnose mutarotase [Microterricola gilva]|uniref:L-rhamnose mutarotase n=1 Tax=Microterricola gilva TaxID=393267 RepID=A0A4V6MGH4_9MICO|nr:L-rhamnose mutarotase [Microterricola gilva]RZU63846.1 L-rhamnose mutarotase [Microterricola gilva]
MTGIVRTARRTRVRPGMAEIYARVHARLPEAVFESLRDAGILSWRIWSIGDELFHVIESTPETEAALERLREIGPVDPEWAALISTLVFEGPGDNELLTPVWGMDTETQWGGEG